MRATRNNNNSVICYIINYWGRYKYVPCLLIFYVNYVSNICITLHVFFLIFRDKNMYVYASKIPGPQFTQYMIELTYTNL